MMSSIDAEAEMENLFAEDEAEEAPGTQSLTQEEAERGGQANLDVTGAAEAKKRVIKNPQPKLNPERLMGPRGIQTIEDLFEGWECKGKGKEFDDLDSVMKKLEIWAHRLYPKLPFDNVIDVIANRLGKKKTVQTHMKKIRLGMVTAPVHVGGGDEVQSDDEREVARYDDTEQPDVFQELLRRAGEGVEAADGNNIPSASQVQASAPAKANQLSDEQKERIRKNKEMAAMKRKEKLEREHREAEAAKGDEAAKEDEIETVEKNEEVSENKNEEYAPVNDDKRDKKANNDEDEPPRLQIDDAPQLDLDEMLEEMDQD